MSHTAQMMREIHRTAHRDAEHVLCGTLEAPSLVAKYDDNPIMGPIFRGHLDRCRRVFESFFKPRAEFQPLADEKQLYEFGLDACYMGICDAVDAKAIRKERNYMCQPKNFIEYCYKQGYDWILSSFSVVDKVVNRVCIDIRKGITRDTSCDSPIEIRMYEDGRERALRALEIYEKTFIGSFGTLAFSVGERCFSEIIEWKRCCK